MKKSAHTRSLASLLTSLVLLQVASCGSDVRRYPLAAPVWEDSDRNHVPKKPGEYFSGLWADALDQSGFRPIAAFFAFPLDRDARNVNAVDEVPNSAWFTNRIGLHPMTPAEAARGPCKGSALDPSKGPWIITGAKSGGATPGFAIKTPSGARYLLKVDGPVGPQRATSADVIGSKIYWAAGFNAPCNQIVYFKKSILKIGKKAKAKAKLGKKTKLTQAILTEVLDKAFRLKSGLIRMSASKFLSGKPLGPFRYESTRGDDPNDVIPHEDRRELRGSRLLSAWLSHVDAREQNTLDLWVKKGRRQFIKHYILDWGDCLGFRLGAIPFNRRRGHSYYVDFGHMLGDLCSLGIIRRPWHRVRMNRDAEMFGFFNVRDFTASKWKAGYPNPAFNKMNFRDALWMTRIISRFSDDHLRAIVAMAKLRNKRSERYLLRTLIGRRDKILAEYLTQYAPLDRFRLVRRTKGKPVQSLCFEDLAIQHKLVKHTKVLYKFRFIGGPKLKQELGWLQFRPDPDHPHRACVVMPVGTRRPSELAPRGAPDNHPLRYGVMKIYIHQRPAVKPTSSMWLHFYDLGPKRGFRLVGMHRQPKPAIPASY